MPKYGKSKNPGARESWLRAKKQNRPRQVWVNDHWEKVYFWPCSY